MWKEEYMDGRPVDDAEACVSNAKDIVDLVCGGWGFLPVFSEGWLEIKLLTLDA